MKLSEVRIALIDAGVPLATADLFLEYHQVRQELWFQFEAAALDLIAKGEKKLFSKQIAENLRANQQATNGFAIDNRFISYYGRMFEIKYPQYTDYFEKRPIRGITSLDTPTETDKPKWRPGQQLGLFARRAA